MSRVAAARQRLYALLRIRNPLLREALGEFTGTFILVLIGDAVIAQVVLGNDDHRHVHGNFTSISLAWGLAIMMGVFFAGKSGKGLINPALNLAFGLLGHIGPIQALVFTVAQLAGAFLGAAVLYTVYYQHIQRFAALRASGELTMNSTGFFFSTIPTETNPGAFYDQVVGTGLFSSGILAITDPNNFNVPSWAHPMLVGLLFVSLVSGFGFNAGAALNPARDLGPRIFTALAGWGGEPFTFANCYFWVPLVGPPIGAVIGAVLYQLLIGIHLMPVECEEPKQKEETAMLEDANC